MDLGQAIYQLLKNDAGIAALLGPTGGITALNLPQSPSYPEIVYRFKGTTAEPTLTTKAKGPSETKLVVHCFDRSEQGVVPVGALNAAVQLALSGYAGTLTLEDSSPEETFKIKGMFFEDDGEDENLTLGVLEVFSVFHIRY